MINAEISKAAAAIAQTLTLEERLSLVAAVDGAETISQVKEPWRQEISELLDAKALFKTKN